VHRYIKSHKDLNNIAEMQWSEEMKCIMVQLIIYDGSCIQKVHRYIKSHKDVNNMEKMQKFEEMQCIMV
jgi:5,10-methylene-tetrahydrofolate dehydrogenase/methenyl tetrahydrofolate cyclohydrolase